MSQSTTFKSTYTWKFLLLTAVIFVLAWHLIAGSLEYRETLAVIGAVHMGFGVILVIAHFLYILIFHPHKTVVLTPSGFTISSVGKRLTIPWEQMVHFSCTRSLINGVLISDGKRMIRMDDLEFVRFGKLVAEIEHWRAKHAQAIV
ncbi:MAG: hypothetical protein HYU64_12450 [Armatimonadetes bacterium]|nr:hypothetical protein [Armatimonadota bacterium]